ncbi:MAG: hypothetical protein ACXAEX_01920 [Promethearchaeota archaeon]|jgi:hypothetical protein
MTAKEAKLIKEKEEKRKIKAVSQIDDLIANQGQYYLKGQLHDALDLAERIIEFAEKEDLTSFIRDQEQFIAKIKGLLQKKEEKEREKIISLLMSELNKLEEDFNSAFVVEDFSKIETILINAKKTLVEIGKEKSTLKWKNLELKYSEAKARKEIITEVLKLIKESSELKDNFLFEELKLRLTYLINQVKEKGINDYLDKLKEIEKETLNAENSYRQIRADINDLAEIISIKQKKGEFKLAIRSCEKLLTLAISINLKDKVEDYSERLIHLKDELEFEELKREVIKFSDAGLGLLKKGKFLTSLEKFNKIKETLEKYV